MEADWLHSADPALLLHLVRDRATDRQFRLFACACCRRVWHLLRDERSRQIVKVAEEYADDAVDEATLRDARAAGELVVARFAAHDGQADALHASSAVQLLADANVARGAAEVAVRAAEALSYHAVRQRSWPNVELSKKARLTVVTSERAEQADLLRHIIGNPFRPTPVLRPWPAIVVPLAKSLYQGEDCRFALHDALLEGGCTEMAVHFAQENHPRGCWLLDLLLSPTDTTEVAD
jgi:phage gp46-like protein